MTRARRYRLLCPIARALDVLGDRWALLILRDLHAGPARYQHLQEGLGLATNLLSTRLTELVEAGLVEKIEIEGHQSYGLTDLGRNTDRILWELSRFGGRLDRDPEPKEPGNFRTIALPLRILLESVPDRPHLIVRLRIDGDTFTVVSTPDAVEVSHGETTDDADLTVKTNYLAFLDLGEGRLSPTDFAARHLEVIEGAEHLETFYTLVSAALSGGA